METTLLLKADDIARLTNISGNVDIDKLTPFIYMAQKNNLRRILGLELYNKISIEFDSETLSGDYLSVYDYIRDILVYYSASYYWLFGHYTIDNAGAYTKTVENGNNLEENSVIRIGTMWEQQGAASEMQLTAYLKTVNIPEYGNSCDSSSTPKFNWYLD